MVRTGARSTVTDAPVLVMTYGSGWIGLLPGQRVRRAGRLQPPRPGDDVTAVLDGRSPPDRLGRPPWWQRAAGHARASLRAAAAGLPPDERGLLPSLVDGDETLVPPALQADMRLTGLTHLEAVSGENLSVTLAITLAVARGVGLRRRARIAACALMLVGFVVLARPSASVQRAAVMGVAALVAMAIGRRATPLPALSVAVTVLVLADPFLGRAVGFVLSVLATAALVTVAPPATQWLSRWLPRPVALAIAVPTAAQLACTPVLLLTFGWLTPYAVPANLLAAIAVVPATVVGVATAVVSSLWRPAAVPLAWLGVLPTGWIADVARTFGGLPGAGMGVPGGPWWWILGVAGAGALGWQVSSRHRDILAGWQR
jgi:competence protein ComEC